MYTENTIIQTVQTFAAVLSILGCTLTLQSIYRKKKYNTITNNLLLYLLILDTICAVFYGIGISGDLNVVLCDIQGLVVQWFGLAEIFWVSYMSYQMYCWIVRNMHYERILKNTFIHFLIILSVTGVLGFVFLGLGYYESAQVWCWIGSQYPDLRFYGFYLILIPAWLFTIIILYLVAKSFRSTNIQTVNVDRIERQNSEKTIQRKLAAYVFVFIFVWFFPLLNRFMQFLLNRPILATSILQAAVLPLRGFLNSMVYGNAGRIIYHLFIASMAQRVDKFGQVSVTYHDFDSSKGVPTFSPPNCKLQHYSIFSTTLNFGEATFDDVSKNMEGWLPRNHDIYVICFQECLDIINLRQLILDYIGGTGQYVVFENAIGSSNTQLGYHGFIGLFIYVKAVEVNQGNILPTSSAIGTMATGVNYIVARAQNKGGVGIPLQIHDTSIAFVSCHLPSDSKGSSKLSKRNDSAHSLLRELCLSPEEIGFDAHFQHDHLIVLGDLNYRMDTEQFGGSVGLLKAVASACEIEKEVIVGKDVRNVSWISKKYDLLRNADDIVYPSEEERKLLLAARAASRSAWSTILSADELRMILSGGDAFYGFFEPLPCFPPSYKRRKNKQGDCGDFTDISRLLQGYSNIGVELAGNRSGGSSIDRPRNGSRNKVSPPSMRLDMSSIYSLSESLIVSENALSRPNDKNGVELSPSPQERNEVYGNPSSLSKPMDIKIDVSDSTAEEGANGSSKDVSNGSRTEPQRRVAFANPDVDTAESDGKGKDDSKIRPPSYTDRILIHSLDDRREKLIIQAYEVCESMRVSDHRPVCMTIRLEVNGAVKFTENVVEKFARPSEGITAAMYELTIQDLTVRFGDAFVDDEEDTVTDSDHSNISSQRFDQETLAEPDFDEDDLSKTFTPFVFTRSSIGSESMSFTPSIFGSDADKSTVASEAGEMDVENPMSLNLPAEKPELARSEASSSSIQHISMKPNKSKAGSKYLRVSLSQIRAEREAEVASAIENIKARIPGSNGTRSRNLETDLGTSVTTPRNRRRSSMATSLAQVREDLNHPSPTIPEIDSIDDDDNVDEKLFQYPAESNPTVNPDNAWKHRVEEKDRILKLLKNDKFVYRIKKSLGEKLHLKLKAAKKKDLIIADVTTVFPIPSKDPLLSHRKVHGVVQDLFSDSSNLFGAYQTIAQKHMHSSWWGNPLTKSSVIEPNAFQHPFTLFPWQEQQSNVQPESLTTSGQRNVDMKISGVVSPELGAHVILKLRNKSGVDLGECVVSLSHLITDHATKAIKTHMKKIPLSSGGQIHGEASATFSLRYLPSSEVSSEISKARPRTSVASSGVEVNVSSDANPSSST